MTTDEIIQLLVALRQRIIEDFTLKDAQLLNGIEKLIPLIEQHWG